MPEGLPDYSRAAKAPGIDVESPGANNGLNITNDE